MPHQSEDPLKVNTSSRSVTPSISRCSQTSTPRKPGSRKMTPKMSLTSMRFWSECGILKESIVQPFRSQSARTLRARTGVENSPE